MEPRITEMKPEKFSLSVIGKQNQLLLQEQERQYMIKWKLVLTRTMVFGGRASSLSVRVARNMS